MKVEQTIYERGVWTKQIDNQLNSIAQLVFIFGSKELLQEEKRILEIKEMYPLAKFAGCSTAGEIGDTFVKDNSIIVTAIYFEKTSVQLKSIEISSSEKSFEIGEQLITEFPTQNLKHVFLFSDGININGSRFVDGCQSKLPLNVNITGGLAADADKFNSTVVVIEDGTVKSNYVTAIGLYGNDLQIGCGSIGGWDIFGIERLVTKSKNNILYEIENKPALEFYKTLLGEKSAGLPGSALLYPLSIRINEQDDPIVRTILSINEQDQSMVFAGDIPQGSYVRLMKANVDRLIDGAVDAVKIAKKNMQETESQFALLISCVGRKLVLKQIVEEEVEGVKHNLNKSTIIAGFYSYGEISPFSFNEKCTLHNQTMTVTVLSE